MARKLVLGAIVLAAGRSTRFGGGQPKVLHPLAGRTMVARVLDALVDVHRTTKLGPVVVVVPPGKQVEKALAAEKYPFTLTFAVQKDPRGTGDAAAVGLRRINDADDVLVVAGDVPLIRSDSLGSLVAARREADAAGALLTAVLDDGGPYGRIKRTGGWITGVVEAKDATPEELAIREISTCTFCFQRGALARALPKLSTDNAQRERYVTDVIGVLIADEADVTSVEGDPTDVLGANTRSELATVARLAREREVERLMAAGVTVLDPATTYVDAGVRVGPETVIHPNSYLQGATNVGSRCEIGPLAQLVDTTVGDDASVTFAKADGAKIGAEATVGPFVSLRPGTVLRKGAKAGTFVEMKNADIGEGTKVPHLAYMGDVTVGRGSNIGAGTITCNYDGKAKHPTKIGDDVFIGSDTILVAPVSVGRGAYTGAGSVVTSDVPAGNLVYGVPAEVRERKSRARPKKKAAKRPIKKRPAKKRPVKKRRGV